MPSVGLGFVPAAAYAFVVFVPNEVALWDKIDEAVLEFLSDAP